MWVLHMCCLQLKYGVDESYTLYIPDSADTLTATLEVSSTCNLLEPTLLLKIRIGFCVTILIRSLDFSSVKDDNASIHTCIMMSKCAA